MAYEQLKERHSVVWGNGPYQRITETLTDIHELIVERLAPRPGVRWLDLACGTGAVAERAARAGADVTGIDLARGRLRGPRRRRRELRTPSPPPSGSCSRPTTRRPRAHHAPGRADRAGELDADERRCRPLQAHGAVPARAAAEQPLRVGRRGARQRAAGRRLRARLRAPQLPYRAPSGEAYWELFATSYGPTKTLAENLGERRAELRAAWVEFFEANHRHNGEVSHEREYLLIVGTRR